MNEWAEETQMEKEDGEGGGEGGGEYIHIESKGIVEEEEEE